MRVITVDRYRPEPGVFTEYRPEPTPGTPSPVPPSFNQAVHLAGAGRGSTWLAATFDVPGPIDHQRLAAAYRGLIARHGTLRSSFDGGAAGPVRLRHPTPTALHRLPGVPGVTAPAIRAALDARCRPFGHPSYLLGAIDRPDTSTVLCGFDHAHVDGLSIAVAIDDLRRLYRGDENLPPVGDFVDHCAEQARLTVPADEPRLAGWRDFFGTDGAVPPAFPLDLGLAPGQAAPQAVELRGLLDTATADRFDHRCRGLGASPFAGVLAAMAHAVRRAGGPDRLRALFPLHTRHHERWRNALGWFTTNAPVEIAAGPGPDTATQRAGTAVRAAIGHGTLPLGGVLPHLGGLRQHRADVFMVSWIDYRALPGARHHEAVDARHISDAGAADDAQFWFSRTDSGLALRIRYPDTARARAVLARFTDDLTEELRRRSGAGALVP